jgi:CubicO group peptidase (beta-lactamase class C family)
MPPPTERVDALFTQWDSTNSPGCVLAIIKDNEFVYKRGYGMADLERNIPITPESMFDIGSTGKQFTATVIAILANQGLLGLDDPIRKYLPEIPAYADRIRIRHLIHHTSGLRDYLTIMDVLGMADENIHPEGFLLDLIVRQKGLNFNPGKEFLYCNTGYFLLGIIAEYVTGKHITKIIREIILEPLGMVHTTFNKDYRPIVKNRAISYNAGGEEGTFINAIALSGGFGDGAMITNVNDLLLWDRNFYKNKLNESQPDLMEQLHKTGKLNNGRDIKYAFGLIVDTYNGKKVVSHGGGWAGYRTEMMRFPDQRFTVICISNFGNIDPTALCQQVSDVYPEHKIKPPVAQKSKLTKDELKSFAGVYQGKYSTVEIYIKEKMLCLSSGSCKYELSHLGKKKFELTGTLDTLSFSGADNEQLTYNEYGSQSVKLNRVRIKRFSPPSTSIYAGEYINSELAVRY